MAAFLRRRRAAVKPADVGLPAGTRRRTPGLRREEVAGLAGMSVDYYIRLEQARGPRPSRQILAAIARALRLGDDERDYLFRVGGEVAGPAVGPSREVRPGVLHLLDRLQDAPALVCDASYDVLAWNPLAAALITDFSALPEAERNMVWRFFTSPRAGERHDPATAEQFARESVADLRAARARYPEDSRIALLVERLLARSPEFARLWAEHEVGVRRSGRKRLLHPSVGWLDLECEAMHLPEADQWVVFFTAPPGSPTSEALALLGVIGVQQLEHRHADQPSG
ncbi:MAG: hypothetical protein V7646_6165 [Pseudonocardia sp.]